MAKLHSADKHRVEVPIRDGKIISRKLGSQGGQAIIEYILVLVVTVGIILGAVYQLNSAFKGYLKTYFGDYIACLLETGELPNIGGSPGDSTICQQVFSPFDPAGGSAGPLKAGASRTAGTGIAGGSRENATGARGGGGGGSSSSGGGKFTAGRSASRAAASAAGKRGSSDNLNTGNTGSSSGSGGYTSTVHQGGGEKKERLDTRFAFDKESEDKQKRGGFTVAKSQPGGPEAKQRIGIKRKERTKDEQGPNDNGMSFGNFIRYLIIAAIIIALVVLVGGQMLQVSKNSE